MLTTLDLGPMFRRVGFLVRASLWAQRMLLFIDLVVNIMALWSREMFSDICMRMHLASRMDWGSNVAVCVTYSRELPNLEVADPN